MSRAVMVALLRKPSWSMATAFGQPGRSPLSNGWQSWHALSMRPLRYSINVTLDGCVHHETITPDDEMHDHHADNLARNDALIFGRVTYEMMLIWRDVAQGNGPDWIEGWMVPFAKTIDAS